MYSGFQTYLSLLLGSLFFSTGQFVYLCEPLCQCYRHNYSNFPRPLYFSPSEVSSNLYHSITILVISSLTSYIPYFYVLDLSLSATSSVKFYLLLEIHFPLLRVFLFLILIPIMPIVLYFQIMFFTEMETERD